MPNEKKQKGEKNVKPIEYNVSKLEKVLRSEEQTSELQSRTT